MPLPLCAAPKTPTDRRRYEVSKAPEKVKALFAAARQWQHCLPFPVDGRPGIGALGGLVVHFCRAGMGRQARRGERGFDCLDAQDRKVQIKTIGHEGHFQFIIYPKEAARLIALRIHLDPGPQWWEVLYDGPTKDIPPGCHRPKRDGIVVLRNNLFRLPMPSRGAASSTGITGERQGAPT